MLTPKPARETQPLILPPRKIQTLAPLLQGDSTVALGADARAATAGQCYRCVGR